MTTPALPIEELGALAARDVRARMVDRVTARWSKRRALDKLRFA